MVNTNGASPLENMRGLEHYLNDMMRGANDSADVKGEFIFNISTLSYLFISVMRMVYKNVFV